MRASPSQALLRWSGGNAAFNALLKPSDSCGQSRPFVSLSTLASSVLPNQLIQTERMSKAAAYNPGSTRRVKERDAEKLPTVRHTEAPIRPDSATVEQAGPLNHSDEQTGLSSA